MTLVSKQSETALLAQWQTAITNTQAQKEIAAQTAKFGYDTKKMAAGQKLYEDTVKAWEQNKKEDRESRDAYQAFEKNYNQLQKLYGEHRKKAKAKFRNQPEVQAKLKVVGRKAVAYHNLMQQMEQFYNVLTDAANAAIKKDLLMYNLTEKEITDTIELIEATKKARTDYAREEGESQDATQQKDKALGQMENWMREYYAMAAIALKETPQLLEAVGLYRKS
ncbi:hypothetical protein HX109_02000 [Galbibacter sp. BG1]|uniref:hypothetical protein n=1 Tax=Galbibacter sp. BG1 TaxID=1170699 RepID=UPI0015BDA762|nr:hypothetical protein [Galbibacter sp. BG1]QLE00389.1 hypothetical protein HX109_02000 [Galbibacter sp. BG1]